MSKERTFIRTLLMLLYFLATVCNAADLPMKRWQHSTSKQLARQDSARVLSNQTEGSPFDFTIDPIGFQIAFTIEMEFGAKRQPMELLLDTGSSVSSLL